ncbi:hypothetical protein FJ950_18535 [Mesorhizobium sp. B2-3-14]|uniref:hypothetical protein n=1 Tax=unclassified Mesorhizobium TaxID=325217 RepID=UPI001125F08A|nr:MULTISPECIES: hypothetical protein [unclassified Mesorhizobium]MBZ9906121.1 hypothetical protein [Mesorhizobium sp. BR115XR7A]MBZ9934157.1 hypothetical protein [Mesorhizobium sp. BR1-1-5]TPL84176.1 hypothetical protein FJ950_18535 [Mesorhizobium sp. B2-3-14]
MIWANRLLFFFNLLFFVGLAAFLHWHASGLIVPGVWEYKDLVAVLLTTVTVVLAFIGVIVAGAAIWGYQSIKSIAEEKAEATSKAGCDDYLKSPVFREQVDQAIRQRLAAEAKEAVQDALGPAVLKADDAPEFQEPVDAGAHAGNAEGDQKWRD